MDRANYKQWAPTLTPIACPFCAKKPKVIPSNPELDGDAWGAVVCTNRRCAVQPKCKDGSKMSDMRGPGAYKDLAIRRWNRRA